LILRNENVLRILRCWDEIADTVVAVQVCDARMMTEDKVPATKEKKLETQKAGVLKQFI
jgi:hypothetical protein